MVTDYYCPNCEEAFSEEKMPDMNRRHHCGKHVRIVRHADEPDRGDKK